jgi:hypothetical protein
MKFTGYGIIWNPKKNKRLVNFKETPEYETNDPYEIEVLSNSDHVTGQSGTIEIKETIVSKEVSDEEKEMTKKEIMESLDAGGIDYNPRDKKEVLLKLLEG